MSIQSNSDDYIPADLRLGPVPGDWQVDPSDTSVDMRPSGIDRLYLAFQRIVDGQVEDELCVFKHPKRENFYGVTAHTSTGRVKDPNRRFAERTTECVDMQVFSTWSQAREYAFDYLEQGGE